jgi:hypothetical protein
MDSFSRARAHTSRLSVLAVTATLVAAAGTATASAADGAAPTWKQADLPVPAGNILGLARLDQHTTWAAGFTLTPHGKGETLNPLLLAQDDRTGTWQRVATPADTTTSRINAISARGAADAWLVGDSPFVSTQNGLPVLTEHWDGRAWQVAEAPVPAKAMTSGLLGVTASGPDNAWAVGWTEIVDSVTTDPSTGMTDIESHDAGLIEHWDGANWHQVPAPADLPDLILNAVTTTAAGDVWAVGETSNTGHDATSDQPVALHYDGHRWHSVVLPKTGVAGELNTVVATGPDDVWAAGRAVVDDSDRGHPLVEHWNGRRWEPVAAPGSGQIHGAAETPSGVVFVGYDEASGATYGERLSGAGWSALGLPTVGDMSTPDAVVAAPGGGLAVAGASDVFGQPDFSPFVLTTGR